MNLTNGFISCATAAPSSAFTGALNDLPKGTPATQSLPERVFLKCEKTTVPGIGFITKKQKKK